MKFHYLHPVRLSRSCTRLRTYGKSGFEQRTVSERCSAMVVHLVRGQKWSRSHGQRRRSDRCYGPGSNVRRWSVVECRSRGAGRSSGLVRGNRCPESRSVGDVVHLAVDSVRIRIAIRSNFGSSGVGNFTSSLASSEFIASVVTETVRLHNERNVSTFNQRIWIPSDVSFLTWEMTSFFDGAALT